MNKVDGSSRLPEWAHRLLQQHATKVGRARRGARYVLDLGRYCWQQLSEDRAPEMAAALTYRTIFSLIPTIVLSLVVLRAFGGLETFSAEIQQKALEYWGFYAIRYEHGRSPSADAATTQPAADDGQQRLDEQEARPQTPPTTTAPATGPESPHLEAEAKRRANEMVRQSIGDLIQNLTQNVASIDFRSIGIVGLLLLIYTALALAMTVEDSLNRVFDCPTRRSWYHRITTYWSVLTLAPVLLLASLYITGRIGGWLSEYRGVLRILSASYAVSDSALGPVGPLLMPLANILWMLTNLVSRLTAIGATWLLMFLLYTLMPNTTVNKRAALIGSFISALLWELAKIGFNIYVTKAVPYSAFYGSLGLIPLFLFWMYLTWLIVLFGAELTHSLQTMDRRRLEEELKHEAARSERQALVDSHWLVPMLAMIGRAFADGQVVSRRQLVQDLRLNTRAVTQMALAMEEARLIHRVRGDSDDESYSLAQPPARIGLPQLLELGRVLALGHHESLPQVIGWDWLERLEAAEKREAQGTTLEDLLRVNGPS